MYDEYVFYTFDKTSKLRHSFKWWERLQNVKRILVKYSRERNYSVEPYVLLCMLYSSRELSYESKVSGTSKYSNSRRVSFL
jgi:hypothetical protein